MKHSKSVVMILLAMFFITQLIGIIVISRYNPEVQQVVNDKGQIINQTTYHLPYGADPPPDISPGSTLISIIIAIVINVIVVYFVLKYLNVVEKFLGVSGIAILKKVFGIVLLALAIKLFRKYTGL